MINKKKMRKWLTNAILYSDGVIMSYSADKQMRDKYKDLKNEALGYKVDIDDGYVPSWKKVEILNFLNFYFYMVKDL